MGEREQKEKRGKQGEKRRKSRVTEMQGGHREGWEHVEHKLPALQQQGLEDGLWRSPDICLQVRTTAPPRADSRQTASLRTGL